MKWFDLLRRMVVLLSQNFENAHFVGLISQCNRLFSDVASVFVAGKLNKFVFGKLQNLLSELGGSFLQNKLNNVVSILASTETFEVIDQILINRIDLAVKKKVYLFFIRVFQNSLNNSTAEGMSCKFENLLLTQIGYSMRNFFDNCF